MVLATVDADHLHMLLDGSNRRGKPLTVKTIGVQLLRRLVGGADQQHALLEHHLQQVAEDDGIANVVDEQLVKTQHPHLGRQFTGQGAQRLRCAGELEQADMHPAHKVMEMLAPRRHPQALVKAVHQPGLAPPHRPPQVHATRRGIGVGVMQGIEAGLQTLGGLLLGRIGSKALLGKGLLVGGKG